MKRTMAVILVFAMCFLLFVGCSNDAGYEMDGTEDSGQTNISNEKTTYTFSEYLRESYDVPLLFFTISKVAKDDKIYNIFVVQDGKVKEYKNYGDKTLGDYARMSDTEILTYLEEEWGKEFCTFVQTFIDDAAWPARFRSGEATIYTKNYVAPKIQLVTDDTGNNVAREIIYFPEESVFTLDSTVWYQGHMWDKTTDYDFVNNRDISSMTSIHTFDSNSKMYEIYSSHYVSLAPAKGFGGRYLLTRTTRDITITLDRDLDEDSFVVDIDYLDEQELAYSFYQQYRDNYVSWDEVSNRFPSLTLPSVPENLCIGYIEFKEFCYIDDSGNLTGYDIELVQKICAELGATVDYVRFGSQSAAEDALLNGTIDCFVGGITEVDPSKFVVEESHKSTVLDDFSRQYHLLVFRSNLDGLPLITQVLDKFAKDGTIGALLNKY